MTTQQPSTSHEIATLGGGCFWCLEAVFEMLRGVHKVESGFSGGETINPTYRQVCNGNTGHAEVVHITFDPEVLTFRELLEVFFTMHDPTTLNRQGADRGTQYRSAVFYHSPEQKEIAEQVIREFNESGVWPNPIVTEVTPFEEFYKADDYHQEYFRSNPQAGYCQMVIAPKVLKMRGKFLDKLKAEST